MSKRKTDRDKKESSNRKLKLLTVVLIMVIGVALLFVGVDVAKTVYEDFDFETSDDDADSFANCAVTVSYYGYYEGEVVQISVAANAPFVIAGQVVDALGVEVTWTVTGQYMDWDTLVITGALKLYKLDYQGKNPVDITPAVSGMAWVKTGVDQLVGSTSYNIALSSLLSGVNPTFSDADTVYWTIQAEVELTGHATDDYGNDYTESTGLMTATYHIYDSETAGFELNGNIG